MVKLLFSACILALLPTPLLAREPNRIDIKGDFNGDGKSEVARIVKSLPENHGNVIWIKSEDGETDGPTTKHDYVEILSNNGYIYILNFPFVDDLLPGNYKYLSNDFKLCKGNKKSGLFASSEGSGTTFIYFSKGRYIYRSCFE